MSIGPGEIHHWEQAKKEKKLQYFIFDAGNENESNEQLATVMITSTTREIANRIEILCT